MKVFYADDSTGGSREKKQWLPLEAQRGSYTSETSLPRVRRTLHSFPLSTVQKHHETPRSTRFTPHPALQNTRKKNMVFLYSERSSRPWAWAATLCCLQQAPTAHTEFNNINAGICKSAELYNTNSRSNSHIWCSSWSSQRFVGNAKLCNMSCKEFQRSRLSQSSELTQTLSGHHHWAENVSGLGRFTMENKTITMQCPGIWHFASKSDHIKP